MANFSSVYAMVRVDDIVAFKKEAEDGFIEVKLDEDYILFEPYLTELDNNLYMITGLGRWYFGLEAIKNINGVSEVLEYMESESGSNFYSYLKDGEEVSEDYFCTQHILDNDVDYFITHYEGCFDSKEDAQEYIDTLEEHKPELKDEKDWWDILIYKG